jgi:hypothetical protein
MINCKYVASDSHPVDSSYDTSSDVSVDFVAEFRQKSDKNIKAGGKVDKNLVSGFNLDPDMSRRSSKVDVTNGFNGNNDQYNYKIKSRHSQNRSLENNKCDDGRNDSFTAHQRRYQEVEEKVTGQIKSVKVGDNSRHLSGVRTEVDLSATRSSNDVGSGSGSKDTGISINIGIDSNIVADVDVDSDPGSDTEDAPCAACSVVEPSEENPMIFCDGHCGACVHIQCYGLDSVPEGEFICEGCDPNLNLNVNSNRGCCGSSSNSRTSAGIAFGKFDDDDRNGNVM